MKRAGYIFFVLFLMIITTGINVSAQTFYPGLQRYIEAVTSEYSLIPAERKQKLEEIAAYVVKEKQEKVFANALFICTHNSRRSIMAQVWFITAANYYGIPNVEAWSGGTEATAFNQRAADALKRAGFNVMKENPDSENPLYIILSGKRYHPIQAWSKKFSDEDNPQKDFFAVMVCSDADASCPVVPGADKRFSLPYDDPRYSDKTASEVKTYDDRCRQIAREMFYLLGKTKETLVREQEMNRK